MTPKDVRSMSDSAIVELLVSLKPSDQAVAWLASVISDDAAFEGVRELRRRFTSPAASTPTHEGRMRSARTVSVSRERWNSFFWRRRMTLSEVGGLMEPPRCEAWASVIGHKGKASFYALDALACALSMRVEDVIEEVGTDEELKRLSA